MPSFLGLNNILLHVYTVLCSVAQLCLTLCDPMDRGGASVHGDSPGKDTGVGCHALLHGIFPTQESDTGLLPCGQILYHLSHQGSARILECVKGGGAAPGVDALKQKFGSSCWSISDSD